MFPDAHTLLATAVLAALLMAGAHLVLWSHDRHQAPLWMASAIMLCCVSAVLREFLPETEAIVLANVTLALGLGAIATACRVLCARRAALVPLAFPALAWLSACTFPGFMADQHARSISSSLSCAAIMAWAVTELRHAPRPRSKACTGLMLILATQGAAAVARAIVIALSADHPQGVARTGDVSRTTFWSFGILLLIGFAITFLVKEQSEQRLRRYIDEDALTGLANRRRFDIELDAALGQAIQAERPLSLLMIDADAFKAYNDVYGHVAGDEALRSIASVLSSTAAEVGGLAARYGGEEFAILLRDADAATAFELSNSARLGIRSARLAHAASPCGVMTVSIGFISLTPLKGTRARNILIAADSALYEAKRTGRDRVRRAIWPSNNPALTGAGSLEAESQADAAQGC